MSSRVSIELHHHGDFTPNTSKGNARYVGGTVDTIDILDPNKLTMYDLNKYALKYGYIRIDFLYFFCDGHIFNRGIRLFYDDESVRKMISLSLWYKKIKIYVDHQKRFQYRGKKDNDIGGSVSNPCDWVEEEDEGHVDAGEGDIDGGQGDLDVGEDDLVGGEGYLDVAEDAFDSEDSEDPDYQAEEVTESETDEELVDARKARKEKGDESDSEYAEGDYNSEELRTDASSSDDENLKQDYVGIALGKKRKKRSKYYNEKYSEFQKWEIGLKFASMEELGKL